MFSGLVYVIDFLNAYIDVITATARSVINFLNSNAGVIIAIATLVFAALTRQYIKLTREIQKKNDTPKVLVFLSHIYLSYEVSTLELCVQNAGTGFAYDVKFAGDLSIYPNISHQPLAEYQIIKDGISHLAPGKVYHIPLFWQYEQSNLPQETLGIVVTYRDAENRKCTETFHLNFRKLEGSGQAGNPPIDSIARPL